MKERDRTRLKRIGVNLLRVRTSKGYTQEGLASRCSVDRAKISKIESGHVNLLVTTLLDLAEGLGVDPFELLSYTTKNKK